VTGIQRVVGCEAEVVGKLRSQKQTGGSGERTTKESRLVNGQKHRRVACQEGWMGRLQMSPKMIEGGEEGRGKTKGHGSKAGRGSKKE